MFHTCLILVSMSPPCDLNLASAVYQLTTSGDLDSLPVDCLTVTFVTNDVLKSLPSLFFDAENLLLLNVFFIECTTFLPPIYLP